MKSAKRGTFRARAGWPRRLVFRLAAIIIGLAPFVLVETLLVVFDWGQPTYRGDPFLGFAAVYPLFVPSEDGTRHEISRSRQGFFRPESFATRKGENEYRIFCLGGSTVQGRPFAIETSLTTWLELNLQLADPSRKWEVVNCGGVSYASYRLVPILEEVLGYEPDLIILYVGHNEFLEDRQYGHIRDIPPVVARPCQLVTRTRTYNLLQGAYQSLRGLSRVSPPPNRPTLGPETDAILEYRDGLEKYHRDEKWRRDVIEHFRYNLQRMVQMPREAGVDLLLLNPVCNLRDCPPFKNQHRDGLTPQQLEQWKTLCRKAGEYYSTDTRRAVGLLSQALAIDDQHAGLHYLLANCYDALGETDQAREACVKAKELDVCPLRILEPMNEAVLDIARRTDTPLVDVRKLFERHSKDGIPGDYLLIDHVHPSIAGHRLIADALTDELIRQGIVHPKDGWKQQVDEKVRQHLDSLGDAYFSIGQERLEALRCWTMGKAGAVRPKPDAETAPGGTGAPVRGGGMVR